MGLLKDRLSSFKFAFRGIKKALKTEWNLRFHFVAALLAIALAFYYPLTQIEWAVVLLCIALVIGAELINTAIEDLADLYSKEFHPKIERLKDVAAAAAVLVFAIVAAIIGYMIFGPHIWTSLGL